MFMLSRGVSGDIGVRFENKKKFLKEISRQIDEAEATGSYVVVSVTRELQSQYEQEYKKIYRRKSIKDKGAEIKKEVQLLKALLGWG